MRLTPPLKQVLVRELIGESLREERMAQAKTLRAVSQSARVSLGYLSEVERGQKEASERQDAEHEGAGCCRKRSRTFAKPPEKRGADKREQDRAGHVDLNDPAERQAHEEVRGGWRDAPERH